MPPISGQTRVIWDNPSAFEGALVAFGAAFPDLVRAALEPIAGEGEAWMMANHPFQNRTGEAEASFFGRVTGDGETVVIELGASSDHSIYLELGTRYMQPYPTILPAMQEFSVRAMAALRSIFG
jgi:hypothetical protein